MSDRYYTVYEGVVACAYCGTVVVETKQHDYFHDRIDRLVTDLMPPPKREPDPLLCAVCGEPVIAFQGRWRHRDWGTHNHAATLTPPETSPHPVERRVRSGTEVWTSVAPAGEEHGAPTEPPIGSVVRCSGCGNVYVHKADGWVNTDDRAKGLAWDELPRPSCGPLRVIYGPGDGR